MKPAGQKSVPQTEREKLGLTEENPRTALSISGVGIRSATFALGAIQAMAQRQALLKDFDYLPTVSGGGYIGSWLTAWKEREAVKKDKNDACDHEIEDYREHAMKNVIDKLNPEAWDGSVDIEASKLAKGEPKEVSYLRAYSNYLTPKLGATSFDFWAIVATVIRNMLLNWTVLIPFLIVVLFIPRLDVSESTG